MHDGASIAAGAEVHVAPVLIHRLDEIAAVEAVSDRHQLRERSDAAGMIAVEVTEDEGVDPLQSGLLCNVEDALRVTAISFVPGIDQHRLAGWRDDQGRSAAFDIDPV